MCANDNVCLHAGLAALGFRYPFEVSGPSSFLDQHVVAQRTHTQMLLGIPASRPIDVDLERPVLLPIRDAVVLFVVIEKSRCHACHD